MLFPSRHAPCEPARFSRAPQLDPLTVAGRIVLLIVIVLALPAPPAALPTTITSTSKSTILSL